MNTTITLPPGVDTVDIVGPDERHLKALRDRLSVSIASRSGIVRVSGSDLAVHQATQVLNELASAAKRRQPLESAQLSELIDDARAGQLGEEVTAERLDVYLRGRSVKPKTRGQRAYLEAILEHDLTFCIGPAGTGKTYLAVAAAVALLKAGKIRKLVLCRPAVEAGEKLGFLPGDLQEKVNPYLRPLLDALEDTMEFNQVGKFLESDVVEIVPLAFMRGRTLNDALIILDEAQNTSRSQMLMFLTRLGHGGKMVVTGDASQIDLPDPRDSGLVDAARRLRRISGVGWVTLGRPDIVRHPLVQNIVEAYGGEQGRSNADLLDEIERESA